MRSRRLARRTLSILAAVAFLVPLVASGAAAQESEAPVLELRSPDGHASARLGAFVSIGAQYRFDLDDSDSNGFSVGNARLAVDGTLVEQFDYFVQLEALRAAPLLDAYIGYTPLDGLRVQAGLFKTPFSGAFLRSAPALDLSSRPQIVNQLAPNRRVGAQLSGTAGDSPLFWSAGVFNGTRGPANANNAVLGAARVGAELGLAGSGALTIAANAAYGSRDALTVPFTGGRPASPPLLLGADARLESAIGFLATELVTGMFEVDGMDDQTVWGYHATAGFNILPRTTIVARWDHRGENDLAEESKVVIGAVAFALAETAPISLQVDYVYPIDDSDAQKLIAAFDAAF